MFGKIVELAVTVLLCFHLANGAVAADNSFVSEILERVVAGKAPEKLVEDEDYFDFLNKIVFKFNTAVMGVGKMTEALFPDQDTDEFVLPFMLPFTVQYKKEGSCNNGTCQEVHEHIQFGGVDYSDEDWPIYTGLYGFNNNDAQINFGISNFSYSFSVPNLRFNSTDFSRIQTELSTGNQMIYSGFIFTIQNATVGLQFDFHFQNGAYQISNLDFTLHFDHLKHEYHNVASRIDGEWTDLGPSENDMASYVNELLEEVDERGRSVEERYETYLEEKINSALAGAH